MAPPFRAAVLILAALLFLLGGTAVGAEPALSVQTNATGEIEFEARGVTIDETLKAIASEAGFEVMIAPGVPRPLVNMTVPPAPVEYILRQILRGRNYALVYDGDAFLSQVILLPPPGPARAGYSVRQRFRAGGVRAATRSR